MSSNRLPGKALKPLLGIPLLAFLFRRLKSSVLSNEIILATSENTEDDVLVKLAKKEKVKVYRGDLEDVTGRFIGAAEVNNIDTVIRVTGDCPFINGDLVDYCIKLSAEYYPFDLCTTKKCFPVGLDVEIYNNSKLSKLYYAGQLSSKESEHLTLYYYNNDHNYKIKKLHPPLSWSGNGSIYTVDNIEDYNRAFVLAQNFDND